MSASTNYRLEYDMAPLAWVLKVAAPMAAPLAGYTSWQQVADESSIAPDNRPAARNWAERMIVLNGEIVTYAGSTTAGIMYFSATTGVAG
jgi:hypothetical protein